MLHLYRLGSGWFQPPGLSPHPRVALVEVRWLQTSASTAWWSPRESGRWPERAARGLRFGVGVLQPNSFAETDLVDLLLPGLLRLSLRVGKGRQEASGRTSHLEGGRRCTKPHFLPLERMRMCVCVSVYTHVSPEHRIQSSFLVCLHEIENC